MLEQSPGDYRYGDVREQTVGPGQVRVRVVASALNHMDLWPALGMPKPPLLPMVPGCDAAGVVAEVGEGGRGSPVGR